VRKRAVVARWVIVFRETVYILAMFILAMFILAVVYTSGGIFLAMFILNQSAIKFTYTLEYA